jgi:hypothetical protein
MESQGYTATRHQAEVGTGYFDRVSTVVSGGRSSTLALVGSTEQAQFDGDGTSKRNGDDAAPSPSDDAASSDGQPASREAVAR